MLQPDSTMLRDHVRSEAQDTVQSIAREVVSGVSKGCLILSATFRNSSGDHERMKRNVPTRPIPSVHFPLCRVCSSQPGRPFHRLLCGFENNLGLKIGCCAAVCVSCESFSSGACRDGGWSHQARKRESVVDSGGGYKSSATRVVD